MINLKRTLMGLAGAAALVAGAGPVVAAPVNLNVFAFTHSSSGSGTPLSTGILLDPGDRLVITAALDDCWSAGGGPRVSNADGLVGDASSPCGGADFGPWSQDGDTFAYGSLVGRIDGGESSTGDWFFVGTGFDQVVGESGQLKLVYWDSNNGDNFGSIAVTVNVTPAQSAVPVPPALGLLLAGGVAFTLLRRRS